jgi:hypothetical protein
MKITRPILLAAAVSALLCAIPSPGAQTSDAGAKTNTLSGTVADSAGKPVKGATVEYWRYADNFPNPGAPEVVKQITTGRDGAFQFQTSPDMGFLFAHKRGLAPAWKQFNQAFNPMRSTELKLVLTPPGTLAGVVMDESNRPVAGARVSVTIAFSENLFENGRRAVDSFAGKPMRDAFSARTDGAGHFAIQNFPTNAAALLEVHSPGKVLRPSERMSSDILSTGYRAGDADIKLVVEPAGGVEGKIAGGETNQPPPIGRLTLLPDGQNFFGSIGQEPVKSAADGSFRFDNVAAGSYHLRASFGTNGSAKWVAESVPVTVESGQVARGVRMTAVQGALLEVSVRGEDDHKPVAQAKVSAYREGPQSTTAVADNCGIARLYLLPGDYQIAVAGQSFPAGQTAATVAAGVTNRAEIEVSAPKKISGVVRAPDGKPAAGLPVQLVGAFGAANAEDKTDANGKFEVDWISRPGQSESTVCVLIRDVEHNLAAAQEVDEDTGSLDLKLAPALTLAGRAEAEGKPITNVTARLVFWTGNRGSWLEGLSRTNRPGEYEIPALPPGRKYGVIVSAPGYGQNQNNNLGISAEPGRQELDPVELKLANLKLIGQVLDADDKPAAGCFVNLNGNNQPAAQVRTDRQGRFVFAHICEGALQLFANAQGSFGNVSAEGGDTNVVLQLGQNYGSAAGAQTHKLKGVVTDAAGKPSPGVQVAVFPSDNGRHWIKTGPNGEYHLSWSIQPWQAQNGGAFLVGRDPARSLAAVQELSEEITNLDLKLEPALTLAGQVKNVSDAPMAGAQVGLWFKAGNSYEQLDEQLKTADADGRYEIHCLPADGKYMVYASAKGYGKSQLQVQNDSDTNRLELSPLVLKLADQMIAGQVLKDDDKPASGVNINLSGEGQPDGNMPTDSKGRFHFQVCEGQIRLFAYSQYGGGNAQATVAAGDTNIVLNLSASPMGRPQQPRHVSLKGSPLPDLAGANLATDAAPAGQPVLLCLFDAGQRPSRHTLQLLEQQAAALKQKNVSVLGIQATPISDDAYNTWKGAATVSFPVGRVTEKNDKTKWTSTTAALPWLILADASHQVVAEGFSIDDLDAQIQKLAK